MEVTYFCPPPGWVGFLPTSRWICMGSNGSYLSLAPSLAERQLPPQARGRRRPRPRPGSDHSTARRRLSRETTVHARAQLLVLNKTIRACKILEARPRNPRGFKSTGTTGRRCRPAKRASHARAQLAAPSPKSMALDTGRGTGGVRSPGRWARAPGSQRHARVATNCCDDTL